MSICSFSDPVLFLMFSPHSQLSTTFNTRPTSSSLSSTLPSPSPPTTSSQKSPDVPSKKWMVSSLALRKSTLMMSSGSKERLQGDMTRKVVYWNSTTSMPKMVFARERPTRKMQTAQTAGKTRSKPLSTSSCLFLMSR